MAKPLLGPEWELRLKNLDGVDGVRMLLASKPLPGPELPAEMESVISFAENEYTTRSLTRAELLRWIEHKTRVQSRLNVVALLATIIGVPLAAIFSWLAWQYPKAPAPLHMKPDEIYRDGHAIAHIDGVALEPQAQWLFTLDGRADIQVGQVLGFRGSECVAIYFAPSSGATELGCRIVGAD